MDRPINCNQINSAGDEIWAPGANTNTSLNAFTSCPASGPSLGNPSSTSNATVTSAAGYSVTVTLMQDAVISGTVTDAIGCTYSFSTTIHAEDVRCFAGTSGNAKVTVCHKTGSAKNPCVTICIDDSAVEEHLAHGDYLGKCLPNCANPTFSRSSAEGAFTALAYPNPTHSYFTIDVLNGNDELVNLKIYDMLGRSVKEFNRNINDIITFGEDLPSGAYFVIVSQGRDLTTLRLIKN
jgi:hypothetical protein